MRQSIRLGKSSHQYRLASFHIIAAILRAFDFEEYVKFSCTRERNFNPSWSQKGGIEIMEPTKVKGIFQWAKLIQYIKINLPTGKLQWIEEMMGDTLNAFTRPPPIPTYSLLLCFYHKPSVSFLFPYFFASKTPNYSSFNLKKTCRIATLSFDIFLKLYKITPGMETR